ncbi:metal ABC transporter ATP-binding protein [Staphylothermus hellenicus]|uniref:ABC transporter related protein n=1 Tax=Staphylothermus hellenicus (strain DSM 12710 / JCM 10830 / BK20S6-10-b1 / P8) TaxID=591019 RepID=D7DBM2_STAHD|nr:metal ABC transporter ATP-binding protein [Staphylothermus hellenicus]ADI31569.1 ABC transporter related protein [Staphylothermus hellenicus DSM 12710]
MVSITVENLTAGYGKYIVLKNLSFKHEGPGLIQVLGPNGAGKTTLLRTILGLIKPMEGRITINGEDVTGNPSRVGKYVGYVPQTTGLSEPDYPLTVMELIECCYVLRKPWPRMLVKSREKERIMKILEMVGLPREVWDKNFWDLSGGQKQRGYLARALVHDPLILLMDEPFSNIDPNGRVDLAELIGKLSRNKLVIATSHDPMLLLKYTTKILLVNRETYVYGSPEEVLRKDIAEKIYGKAVLEVREHIHIIDSHR